MSLKQTKSTLEKYAESGTPVLLHGKGYANYKKLVLDIHKSNGGIERVLDYMQKGIKTEKEIDRVLEKAWEDNDLKGVEKIIFNCKNTSRTYKYYDFDSVFANKVLETLLAYEFHKSRYIEKNMLGHNWYWKSINKGIDLEPPIINAKRIGYTLASPIFRKGLLFLDNLYFRKGNDDDFECYRVLADVIKVRETKGTHKPHFNYNYMPGNSFIFDDGMMKNWLVAYTQDPNCLPGFFLKQFKLFKLNDKTRKTNKEDAFDDVKLKMNVDYKGNYSCSHYEVSVKCKDSQESKLKLPRRFMPALFLLAKGVNDDSPLVSNSVLKKTRVNPDDATKEIKISFTNIIGLRAKTIIEIVWGEGKILKIPKKNITLKENSPF